MNRRQALATALSGTLYAPATALGGFGGEPPRAVLERITARGDNPEKVHVLRQTGVEFHKKFTELLQRDVKAMLDTSEARSEVRIRWTSEGTELHIVQRFDKPRP